MRRTLTISTRFGFSQAGFSLAGALSVGILSALVATGCGTAFWGEVPARDRRRQADKAEARGATRCPKRKQAGPTKSDKDADEHDKPRRKRTTKPRKTTQEKRTKDEKKDEKEKAADEVAGHVDVRCVPARRRAFEITVDGLGRTEPLPASVGSLTAAVEGHVHKLLVKLGDTVKSGQAIVQLDLTVAQATLAEKTANRDSLVAALKLLESLPRPERTPRPNWQSKRRRLASNTMSRRSKACVRSFLKTTSRTSSFTTRKCCSSRPGSSCERPRRN